MAFEIKKAIRERIYVKIALIAPSGGGKTYSSLRLATGMGEEIQKISGKKAKILMANTESSRGRYYANEFDYDIVDIESPHNPEKYVELINFAVSEGYDILIMDSTTHEWEGKGGCLEIHQQAGGQYQHWKNVTPRHNKFLEAIADSKIHIIATMRGKDAYETSKDDRGKTKVEKLGVGAKQRDGFEFEFTCSFLIDQKTSMAEYQKDNTHIFDTEGAVLLSEEYGKKIIKWANSSDIEPVQRKVEPSTDDSNTPLTEVIKNIDKIAPNVGEKVGKDELKEIIKKHHNSANYKSIKDLESAKNLLKELEEIVNE